MEEDEEERDEVPELGLPLPFSSNVTSLPSADRGEKLRIIEALLFAADEPLDEAELGRHFGADEDIPALLEELKGVYASRGVNLVRVAGKWAFRTADDLSYLLERQTVEQRRLSRAALETLAIIAYHQPVTRAEIEEIRGVSTSKGTLDVLLETGWIKLRGRRRAPGRPVTYGTTPYFLEHFGFDCIEDLPGLGELKGAGLLDSNLPPGFAMPSPSDSAELREDEDPLEDEDEGEAFDDEEAGEEMRAEAEDDVSSEAESHAEADSEPEAEAESEVDAQESAQESDADDGADADEEARG
ncbi:SMC-Scp complex subunit ScpB [Methyloligella sp. 2.7D]|uniref:SMC-Scp complex subunit ScpB n=1 Tax=unclassified Methyloligella TaxID=2625955 RepID=UPI00157D3D76|nr:SMC-Scp complex subunit ScpB [Methyloligella sp. GL2]QKP77736.1 SMC-Scp complex subunit ScpB [Methyloligella sp. GL2]